MEITLLHYIVLALIIFAIGFIGLITSRNIIKALICIEIIMSAVNINFIAFTTFKNYMFLSGMVFSLFVIAISAVQSAIALVLIYLIYKDKSSLTTEEIEELKG